MKFGKLCQLIFDKKKGKKKDNRGVTLIELIVTVAVLSVVLVMIFSMMTSGATFYSKSNDSIATTYSLQQTLSQIKETVIDCNHCIIIDKDASDNKKFTVVNMNVTSTISGGTETVNRHFHFYAYSFEGGVIKYGEVERDNLTETEMKTFTVDCDHVLCGGVEDFKVAPTTVSISSGSLSDSYIKRLKIDLKVKKNNRVDSAVEAVSPRNMTRQVKEYENMPVE